MKPLLFSLCAALMLHHGVTVARACQYCRMAAMAPDDPEMARLAAEMHTKAGGFPLDGTINQFQAAAPAANLTVPPSTSSVATRAADLPAPSVRRLTPPPPVKTPAHALGTSAAPIVAPNTTDRWANGGLLGLLGLAGFFGWRTRRSGGAGGGS